MALAELPSRKPAEVPASVRSEQVAADEATRPRLSKARSMAAAECWGSCGKAGANAPNSAARAALECAASMRRAGEGGDLKSHAGSVGPKKLLEEKRK